MFARRRSSSPTKSIAFLACLLCCIAVHKIENVASMSLDRLAIDRNNASQMDYVSEMLSLDPEELNESGSVSNSVSNSDMMIDVSDDSTILVPVKEGQSDVYLLVPAAGSQSQQAEDMLQSLAEEQEGSMDDTSNSEGVADMMMLESEDTPSMQILEAPADIMEVKLEGELQNNLESANEFVTQVPLAEEELTNSDSAQTLETEQVIKVNQTEIKLQSEEPEAVTEGMIDMIAETVEEIEKELESEILGTEEEDPKNYENDLQIHKSEVEHENENIAEMLMEHKDDESPEKTDTIVSEETQFSAIQEIPEKQESEQEMIGVLMEQEPTEAPIETDDLKVESEENIQLEDSEQTMNDSTAEETEITTEIWNIPMVVEDMSQMASSESEQIQALRDSENVEKSEKTEEPSENMEEQQLQSADMKLNEEDQQMVGEEGQGAGENQIVEVTNHKEDNSEDVSAALEALNPVVEISEAENEEQAAKEILVAEMTAEPIVAEEMQSDDETKETTTDIPAAAEEMPATEETLNLDDAPAADESQMMEHFLNTEEFSTSKADDFFTTEELVLADDTSVAEETQSVEEASAAGEISTGQEKENQDAAKEISTGHEEENPDAAETATQISEEISVTDSPVQYEESAALEDMQIEQNTQRKQIVEEMIPVQTLEISQPIAEDNEIRDETKEIEEQLSVDQSQMSEEPTFLAAPDSFDVSQTTEEAELVNEPHLVEEADVIHEAPQPSSEEVQNTADEQEANESQSVPEQSKLDSNDIESHSDEFKPAEVVQLIEESQSAENVQPIQENIPANEEVQMVEEDIKSEDEPLHPADDLQSFEDAKPSEDTQVEPAQSADDSQSFEDAKHPTEDEQVEQVQSAEELQSSNDLQSLEDIKPSKDEQVEQVQSAADSQSLEDIKPPSEDIQDEQVQSAVVELQQADDLQSLEDIKPSEATQFVDAVQFVEPADPAEILQPAEESQTVEESQTAGEFMNGENLDHEEEVLTVAESQPAEDEQAHDEVQSMDTSETAEEALTAAETEEVQSLENSQTADATHVPSEENLSADVSAPINDSQDVEENQTTAQAPSTEELAQVLQGDASEASESFPMSDEIEVAKQQTSSAQIEILGPVQVMAADELQKEESLSASLTDEESLQTIETVEESQHSDTSEQSMEDKDDPILNDDNDINNNNNNLLHQVQQQEQQPNSESADKPQEPSMLTTILQVPPPPPMPESEMQQQQTFLTTVKPLSVMDSVLNYVNASFMSHQPQQELEKEDEPFSSQLRRYDGAQVWRIVVQNDRERKLADELQTKYDGQLWKEVKQEVDYLLKPQVLADAERYVRAANLSRIVLIDNLQQVIEVENPPAEEIAQLQNRKGHRLTWQAYHRLEDIHGFFDYMAKTYPDICSVETIGYSIEKRPLKLLKISNGNTNNPGIWIDGGMHAREWIGVAVVTYIANQIVEGWDDLPAHMRNVNWYIHAVANPDGYEYSHTTDRLWRKNMRSHGRACPGVDLNRNFGYKWGGKGTSANPCSQTYRGSKAFSEPETFYISKFISNFPRDTFKGFLSFHSYGQYILYPWGYDYHITKDMTDLDLIARQAGTSITRSSGVKYTVGSSAHTLYPAAGGSDDWAKGFADIKYSYTIEMGDTGRYGFVLPASHIEPNGKDGLTFAQTVARAITMGHRLTWQAYHRLEDIHGFFDYMAKTYPDICSVETIGYSIEKRPLKLLKISNGNTNNPGIWIDGGMHAREWIGVAVVTYIANQIVEGWDDLPAHMRNVNWYIHAVANPDGYEYSHTTDRLWRKNMRSHGRACPGVDLNRNFGYKWGGKGTSANPCSQTYRGSKAFSEPETFYISKFISNFPRDTFKGFLSFHSYGQYILYPWGYDYHITKDMTDLDLIARQAGTSITRSSGVKYTVGSSAHTLYPAAGGSDDWAKGFADIKYSYTIEMGDTGRYGFVLPASHIEPNGKDGLTFAQTVARAITMGKNSRRRKLVRKTN